MLDCMDKTYLTVVVMGTPQKSLGAELRQRQGDSIRRYRKAHKMSQAGLAEAVGVTKAAVSEWENGKSSPRPHHQIAIARAFRAPWSVLFGLDGEAA